MEKMKASFAIALGFTAALLPLRAGASADFGASIAAPGGLAASTPKADGGPKAATTQTLGSRATVTMSGPMYGGFVITTAATVYILVRGNSLGTLNVTQGYLDAPRVRLFNGQGGDLALDLNGNPGFNGCVAGSSFSGPVVTYYQTVRGEAVNERDGCVAAILPAGIYTFRVQPSVPGVTTVSTTSVPAFGEVLFEVTFNP